LVDVDEVADEPKVRVVRRSRKEVVVRSELPSTSTSDGEPGSPGRPDDPPDEEERRAARPMTRATEDASSWPNAAPVPQA
jgi:hypothetical protein